jgi:hypothetical protein
MKTQETAMTAVQKEQQTINELYSFICASENLKKVAIRFCQVGRGGAKCTYSNNKVHSISIDLFRINFGAAYVLCHEVAHQVEIVNNGNATHNAAFKKAFNGLRKKYENCQIARNLIF